MRIHILCFGTALAAVAVSPALAQRTTGATATVPPLSLQRPVTHPAGATGPVSASLPAPTLRCTKQRDHALVYNGGPGTLTPGAIIEVHATGATQEAEGAGNGTLDKTLAPGQSWLHPIKFSMNFTQCAARVIPQ